MRTRKLGKSEIEVSEIALGTWGLSGEAYGPVEPSVVRQTLDAALDAGVTLIDTASCYGKDGAVEKHIGAMLKARGRSSAMIALRVGVERVPQAGGAELVRKRFEGQAFIELTHKSLDRLGTDYVDVLMMHNPLPSTTRRHREALSALRAEGVARLIGVSAGSIEVAREALKLDIDVIEIPYNALYPRLLNSISSEIISSGVGVMVRSPLAYGLLAGTWGDQRKFDEGDHRMERWTPQELAARVKQREGLRFLVEEDGEIRTLREAALRYVLANRMISCAVVGARSPVHARENAAVSDTHPYLTPQQLGKLGQELRAVNVQY